MYMTVDRTVSKDSLTTVPIRNKKEFDGSCENPLF